MPGVVNAPGTGGIFAPPGTGASTTPGTVGGKTPGMGIFFFDSELGGFLAPARVTKTTVPGVLKCTVPGVFTSTVPGVFTYRAGCLYLPRRVF